MAIIKLPDINFIDLVTREAKAREFVRSETERLETRKEKVGNLGAADEKELNRLSALARVIANGDDERDLYCDPLFATVRAMLFSNSLGLQSIEIDHDSVRTGKAILRFGDKKPKDTARIALVLGLLQLRGATPPELIVNGEDEIVPDPSSRNYEKFAETLVEVTGRASARLALANSTLKTIARAVDVVGDGQAPAVSTLEFARVFEKLVERRVSADDPNLRLQVEDTLDRIQDIGSDKPMHEFEINLPDLEATTEFEVVGDHCRLMGSFIFASAFEELKAFQVVDRLIEMSQRGDIPLIRGAAGTQLYTYWREAPNRMSEIERQNFYAMTLGLPTGAPGVAVNSDFQDLWLRFVSSVSSLVRESRVDRLIRSSLPNAINQQQVKKAARDLAVNMSSRGYGMVFYAAADLQKQINDMITLLSDRELRSAFGARDMWGVIDQIAQTELGGARNSSKYRMLATSGAIITNWIANNIHRLRDPTLPMVELGVVENPPSRASGETAVSRPSDYDLVNACEMWLADSALGEDRVEIMSQPRESPQATSRPIQIPSIARDLLEGAGLSLGMGTQQSRTNGNGRPYAQSYQGY